MSFHHLGSYIGGFSILALAGAFSASAATAPSPYFDIRCGFKNESALSCSGVFRLCAGKEGDTSCSDQGQVDCSDQSHAQVLQLNGEFERRQEGKWILLQSSDEASTESVLVAIGPAKTPPRPGQPVVSNSRLEWRGNAIQGECSVRLIR